MWRRKETIILPNKHAHQNKESTHDGSFSKYISKKKCIYGNYDKYEQFQILWLWQQAKHMRRRQEGHRNLQMVQVLLKHFHSRTNKRDYMRLYELSRKSLQWLHVVATFKLCSAPLKTLLWKYFKQCTLLQYIAKARNNLQELAL